jgi:hypothetical protein
MCEYGGHVHGQHNMAAVFCSCPPCQHGNGLGVCTGLFEYISQPVLRLLCQPLSREMFRRQEDLQGTLALKLSGLLQRNTPTTG